MEKSECGSTDSGRKRNKQVPDTSESTKSEVKEKKAKIQSPDTDPEDINVHSANAWEEVSLGDDGRKKKFLRLMGAANTKHQGRFVIGDTNHQHTKASKNAGERVSENLEKEFQVGLEHKHHRHAGIGFSSSSDLLSAEPVGHVKFDSDGNAIEENDSKDNSKKSYKSSFVNSRDDSAPSDPKEKYKMKFVKGSS